jgi:hypothetical protein
MAMRTKKRKKAKASKVASGADVNRAALWKAYKDLQVRADKAWDKFRGDIRRHAKSDILIQDHSHLLLLLGECNYMARECMRMASKNKKKK